ncbi:MAG: hypothetical protein R3B38_00395 [Patescibacteria group bacterium]
MQPDENIIKRMEAGEDFSDEELFPDLYSAPTFNTTPPWERAASAMNAIM